MSTALTTSMSNAGHMSQMSKQDIIDRKRKIAEVMDAVMKDGEHYGKIPGCGDKPTLYKAGAEVLATTFGLAPSFDVIEVTLPGSHREYRITCRMRHIATGADLGEGIGMCSTMESKYRWRKAERKCPNCGQSAIIKGKAEYGGGWVCFKKKGGCDAKWNDGAKEIESQESGRVENHDISDTYNTVLKIAKKRALVDCTLTVVGASDILAQDLEDLPPGTPEHPADEDLEVRELRPRGAADPASDKAAAQIVAELQHAKSADDVRRLAPRVNALPKGTRGRYSAWEAYQKRLGDIEGRVAPDPDRTDRKGGDPLKDRLADRRAERASPGTDKPDDARPSAAKCALCDEPAVAGLDLCAECQSGVDK